MKKIIALGLALFLNTISAQVNIDFNTQSFPANWTMQGNFELSNADIHPRCQQNGLIGSIFTQESVFWIQTASYNYSGGDIEINITHGIKDLYHALGVNNTFQKPELFLEYAEGDSENWIVHDQISLDNIDQSTTCLSYTTRINASNISGFESIKYRFVYNSPAQTGMLYLLYWSIDAITIENQVALSVNDFNSTDLFVYPNPVLNELNISSTQEVSEIIIYNLIGQKVFSKIIDEQKNIAIDISNFSSGNYILKIRSKKSFQTLKLIKS